MDVIVKIVWMTQVALVTLYGCHGRHHMDVIGDIIWMT